MDNLSERIKEQKGQGRRVVLMGDFNSKTREVIRERPQRNQDWKMAVKSGKPEEVVNGLNIMCAGLVPINSRKENGQVIRKQ